LPTPHSLRHREPVEKGLYARRIHFEKTVRLPGLAGHLGQKLVVRNAHRRGEFQFVADLALDAPPDFGGVAEQQMAVFYIQEGLVKRQRFDERRVAVKNVADLLRNLGVIGMARRRMISLGQRRLACDVGMALWMP
jgi:hypothetical protein